MFSTCTQVHICVGSVLGWVRLVLKLGFSVLVTVCRAPEAERCLVSCSVRLVKEEQVAVAGWPRAVLGTAAAGWGRGGAG